MRRCTEPAELFDDLPAGAADVERFGSGVFVIDRLDRPAASHSDKPERKVVMWTDKYTNVIQVLKHKVTFSSIGSMFSWSGE